MPAISRSGEKIIYMTVRLVLGSCKEKPEELARSLVYAMPAELYDLFRFLGLVS